MTKQESSPPTAVSPLVSSNNSNNVQLYDPDSMLEISKEVAKGFQILLSGGLRPAKTRRGKRAKESETAQANKEIEDSSLSLAFMSLTDGNVVDACFGVNMNKRGRERQSDRAFRLARTVKALLADVSDENQSVRRVAVGTYEKAFEILMQYHDEMSSLNFITWCFKYSGIQKQNLRKLQREFQILQDAIAANH
mmetsp:Transcript_30922/g.47409  ORF Transcript_30922/g.47409 Transcript_30922/m.47409 type:complete len:194 (-) Transcript_30922:1368-1949(-)